MSATTISEGNWIYRATGWMSPFTVTDRRTGQVHQTTATNVAGARAFVATLEQAEDTPEFTVTIGSGPQRARAGHQRYTQAFAA